VVIFRNQKRVREQKSLGNTAIQHFVSTRYRRHCGSKCINAPAHVDFNYRNKLIIIIIIISVYFEVLSYDNSLLNTDCNWTILLTCERIKLKIENINERSLYLLRLTKTKDL
jgi:hypothetical protein